MLIFSPQGIKAKGMNYNNIFTVVYLVGKLDLDNLIFDTYNFGELDRGFDFYAPQSFKGKNDENILFAWAGMGEFKYPTDDEMWSHMLTFPRVLSLKDNKIISKIAKEIELIREDEKVGFDIIKNEEKIIENDNNSYEFNLDLEFLAGNKATLEFFKGDNESLKFIINGDENKLTLDKSNLSNKFAHEHGNQRSCLWNFESKLSLKVIADKSIIEIFINDGEEVFTSRAFPLTNSTKIAVSSQEQISYHYSKYKIKKSITGSVIE